MICFHEMFRKIINISFILLNLFAPSLIFDNSFDHNPNLASLEWAWYAYQALNVEPGHNVFFSPHSIQNALGILLLGSSGQSEDTLRRILETNSHGDSNDDFHLHMSADNMFLSESDPRNIIVSVANGVFINDNLQINKDFRLSLREFYGGSVRKVPFQQIPEMARMRINAFIQTKTEGNIQNFLASPLETSTAVLLVNAIYFKAGWAIPFKPHLTKPMIFHGSKSDFLIDMMFVSSQQVPYSRNNIIKCEMFELPYVDSLYSMYVILPFRDVQLSDLETVFDDSTPIVRLLESMRSIPVDIRIPKFKMEFKASLRQMLVNFGAEQLFDPQTGGDNFANMFAASDGPSPNVGVNDVMHAARVEVNETGTSASAVTAIQVTFRSSPLRVFVNRPFLFFIRHKETGIILFWGRMENPLNNT